MPADRTAPVLTYYSLLLTVEEKPTIGTAWDRFGNERIENGIKIAWHKSQTEKKIFQTADRDRLQHAAEEKVMQRWQQIE